jgi:diguanylate cyclase (GGDEF)-like protein
MAGFAVRPAAQLAQERVPRLVARFALLTVVGLTVAASLILAVVQHAYAVSGEQRAVAQARLTAQSVLPGLLRPSDLERKVPAARRRQLDRLISQRVLVGGPVASAIYNRGGRLIDAIGPHAGSGIDLRSVKGALSGTVFSSVGPARFGSGRALRTFLPVNVNGKAIGVVVLEQDYGPIAAASRHSSLLIAAVLEGVLVALFVLLIPMLARATRRIGEQVSALDLVASRDELTGLSNRLGFRRAYETIRETHPAGIAMLVVDLDGFHELNDTLGPESGDILLTQIAERLASLSRPEAVGRLGEDEFGLLLGSGGHDEVATATRELQDALAAPLDVAGIRIAATVTVGAAPAPRQGGEFAAILRQAGVALTLAKEQRLPFQLYSPANDEADSGRVSLTAELRQALREGQLCVYYQPQADLTTHTIRGVEALVRWQHPERGLLQAAEFMPQAERSGLVSEIDRYVLETAASQWRKWNALGLSLDLAVNISAVDLLDPQLAANTVALIKRVGLPARHLTLEITEHTLLRNEEHLKRTFARLTEVGIRLAVDDYGTGYASLRYLRNLPVDQVKLDGTFTAGIPGDSTNEKIVASTIALAHALGATVVAEGVETIGQWRHLATHHCDLAQGHLIGPPQPADQLRRELITNPVLPTRLQALRSIPAAI